MLLLKEPLHRAVVEFRKAFKIAIAHSEAAILRSKGFFANSGITILPPGSEEPESWTVTFYNSSSNRVVQASVNKRGVSFSGEGIPLNASNKELKLKDVKLSSETALEKAFATFRALKRPLSQVILTVDASGWHANFVTKDIHIIIVGVDFSGKVVSQRDEPLTREPVGPPS
ncbi:hypothetical protein HY546_02995 [archaeon]|nr:hypothetical protein [archaeon]